MVQLVNDAFVFMGGTFDPIHNGHLRTALEIQQWLSIPQVSLIPSKQPVHRDAPGCTSEQRLAMVTAAVADEPALNVDPREVNSDQPSYSLLTLQGLREALGPSRPLCMVMGMDAYLSLSGWHRWEQFLDYAHLLVVARPGYQFQPNETMRAFTEAHQVTDKARLLAQPAGHVMIHEMTPLAISATQVRQLITDGHSPRYLLPDPVWAYIQEHNLYGFTTN